MSLKDQLANVSDGRELQIQLLKGSAITNPSPVDDSSTHLTSGALRIPSANVANVFKLYRES